MTPVLLKCMCVCMLAIANVHELSISHVFDIFACMYSVRYAIRMGHLSSQRGQGSPVVHRGGCGRTYPSHAKRRKLKHKCDRIWENLACCENAQAAQYALFQVKKCLHADRIFVTFISKYLSTNLCHRLRRVE